MKKSMQILITLASFSLILSGCGEEETKEKGATKIESNTSQDDAKDKKVSNGEKKEVVTTEDRDKDTQQSTKEGQLTLVNGVSHYNFPSILNKNFADSILSNTFNIEGWGINKEVNVPSILREDRKLSHENSLKYDNFEMVLGGDIYTRDFSTFVLEVKDQGVRTDDLIKAWGVKVTHKTESSIIYDGINNNGYHVVVTENADHIVETINIRKGDYKNGDTENNTSVDDPNIEMRDGTAYYNFPDITNFDFAYQVCTAAFKINGIGLGDTPNLDDLGEYSENGTIKEFGNFGFEMIEDRVIGIKLNVADQNVHIDALEKAWKSKVDIRKENSIFYDNDKTNGFLVRVDFDDNGIVQEIFILGLID